jgi:hypothetical protein
LTRHRLIPAQGKGLSWFVNGREQALARAHEAFRLTKVPILVVAAPEGGLVQTVQLVGDTFTRNKRRPRETEPVVELSHDAR